MARPKITSDRFYVPLLLNGLLGLSWYFVIYNRSGAEIVGRAVEPLFYAFALFLPLIATLITSLLVTERQWVGLMAGLSLVGFSYIGTWLHTKDYINLMEAPFPNYYRDFEQAGSFDLVFLFYGLLFILVGAGLGRFCRIFDPPVVIDSSIGSLSRNQRRSKKKRKKAMQQRRGDVEKFVEEILDDEDDDTTDDDAENIRSDA